ncbi:hypothetical protein C8Q76DRAFT_263331 [Earliella scabrosa]|nr:hypothetical protein C8Q76DRAFT_263331 [Earliella scabrosa]
MSVVRRLLNGARPVNCLPPEILLRIFSLAPEKYACVTKERATHWPFLFSDPDDVQKLTQVCTYWRQIALGCPTLWSTCRETPLRRITKLDSLYLTRCPDRPIDVFAFSSFSSGLKQILFERGSHIRQFHVHFEHARAGQQTPDDEVVSTLTTIPTGSLEHLGLVLSLNASAKLLIAPSGFSIGTNTRLRSLYLTVAVLVPQWRLPSLTRCVLSAAADTRFASRQPLDTTSLLAFLSGTPKLEVLCLHHVSLDPPPPSANRPSRVALNKLRYLAYKPLSFAMAPLTTFISHVLLPPTCRLDIDNMSMTRTSTRELPVALHALRGPTPPTKLGIHARRSVVLELSLELSGPSAPGLANHTRLHLQHIQLGHTEALWRSLITPEFCANLEELRVDATTNEANEHAAADEFAAMWPLLGTRVRKLSVAFRWPWSERYIPALRRTLEPFVRDGPARVFPVLDTLDVYVTECADGVVECLAEVLAARAETNARVRRVVLCATAFSNGVPFPREHVEEFVTVGYKHTPKQWMDWPVPLDDEQLVGADWPTWC